MVELKYGRYFVLKDQTKELFAWAEANIGGEMAFYFCGLCGVTNSLILNAIFEAEEDRDYFEREYLHHQSNNSSIYANRRTPEYQCNASAERRGNVDRRGSPDRRSVGREHAGRRSDLAPASPVVTGDNGRLETTLN